MRRIRGSGVGLVDIVLLRRALGAVAEDGFAITGTVRVPHREVSGRHQLTEQHGQCNEPTGSGKPGHRRSVASCRRCGTLCADHRPGAGGSRGEARGQARDILPVGQLMIVMSVGGSAFTPRDVLHHGACQEPVGGVAESSGEMVDELGVQPASIRGSLEAADRRPLRQAHRWPTNRASRRPGRSADGSDRSAGWRPASARAVIVQHPAADVRP
jgi:hypothetical protein